MTKVVVALLLAIAVAAPAGAQPAVPAESLTPPQKGDRPDARPAEDERRAARLDVMFGRLAATTDERRANRIARHIMRRMAQSGSDTVDFLMTRAALRMRAKEYGQALDLLDGVIRLEPEFAEGWNRRATVHFLAGNLGQSIADIEQVLQREPRHFGALAGLAMILRAMDRKPEALAVMDRALTIHPHLPRMRERRDRLRLELEGSEL
ncbi:MAG: tetratricopeptide repeat protein [Pseudomonadota bacterium]